MAGLADKDKKEIARKLAEGGTGGPGHVKVYDPRKPEKKDGKKGASV